MKKDFSVAFLIPATIIGAGFASGREIRNFFAIHGAISILFVPLVFLLLYFGCSCFFATGRRWQPNSFSDASKAIFGRWSVFFDFVMVIGNLVFMAGMLAGLDSLGQSVVGISHKNPVFSLTALVICAVIVLNGVKGLSKINNLMVPVIVLFMVGVCLFSIDIQNLKEVEIVSYRGVPKLFVNSILFIFSNIFTCAGVLYQSGREREAASLKTASLTGAVIVSTVLLLFILASMTSPPTVFEVDMPMFYLSQALGGIFQNIAVPALVFAIFTTLLSNMCNLQEWMSINIGNKYISVTLIAALSFTLRSLGFNIIVDYLYVGIGIFGAIYCAGNIIFLSAHKSKAHCPY